MVPCFCFVIDEGYLRLESPDLGVAAQIRLTIQNHSGIAAPEFVREPRMPEPRQMLSGHCVTVANELTVPAPSAF